MIAAVFCVHCVLILFLCQPLSVNQSDVKMRRESTVDSAIMQAMKYMQQSDNLLSNMPWKEVIQALVSIVTGCYIVYQILRIKRKEEEVEAIFLTCMETDNIVRRVEEFYENTECLFDLLNNKANFIKQRFDNAKKIIDDRHIFDRLNNVMNALKQDWDHEFDKIRRMEINFIDPIRTEDVKAQLVMAKGFVDQEIQRVYNNMEEDKMSLEEVSEDVQKLKKYFDRTPTRRAFANYRL